MNGQDNYLKKIADGLFATATALLSAFVISGTLLVALKVKENGQGTGDTCITQFVCLRDSSSDILATIFIVLIVLAALVATGRYVLEQAKRMP